MTTGADGARTSSRFGPPGKTQPRVGANGRFLRGVESLERDAEALRLRARGHTFQQISDELGYGSSANAHKAMARVQRDIPAEAVEDLRKTMDEKYAAIERRLIELSECEYPVIYQGVPVDIGDGDTPVYLLDAGPVRAVLSDLMALYRDQRKLHGMDVPVRQELAAETTVRYEIAGVDMDKLR